MSRISVLSGNEGPKRGEGVVKELIMWNIYDPGTAAKGHVISDMTDN